MIPEYNRNEDETYGPVETDDFVHYYQSKSDHRNTAQENRHKTRWSIKESQEFHLFKIADQFSANDTRWFCEENNCLFSILDNGEQLLGKRNERLAKFPKPTNQTDTWHGYPVTCKSSQDIPSEDLLDIWEKETIITKVSKRRIETKKL